MTNPAMNPAVARQAITMTARIFFHSSSALWPILSGRLILVPSLEDVGEPAWDDLFRIALVAADLVLL